MILGHRRQGTLPVGKELEATVLDMIEQSSMRIRRLSASTTGRMPGKMQRMRSVKKITEAHPDVEVEVHYGGQPIYYYVISVE